MPKLSIIVPVYNTEKYLKECIESIIAQTFKDYELILVDDGSTDKSGEICDSYISENIFVFHKKNGGAASARSVGVKAAKGKYIGFVDSDDWIDPNMYATMIAVAEENKVDLVISDIYYEHCDRKTRMKNSFFEGIYNKEEISKTIIPRMICDNKYFVWGIQPNLVVKLFKREKLIDFADNLTEEIIVGEDAGVLYPYICSCESLYCLNACFYHYRIGNNNSASKCYEHNIWQKNKWLYEYLLKSCNNNCAEQIQWYYIYLTEKAVYKKLLDTNSNPFEKFKTIRINLFGLKNLDAFKKKTIDIPFKKKLVIFCLYHRFVSPIYLYRKMVNKK